MDYWNAVMSGSTVYATRLPAALLTILVGYVLLKIVRGIVRTGTEVAKIDRTVESMVLSIVSFAGWIFIIAAGLSVIGLSQLSLALGGSVALMAMALASGMNNVTQDLLSGIFLLADPDFVVGLRVKAAGVEGTVEALSIRKTKIRDKVGQLHTVPNRSIDSSTYVLLPPEDTEDTSESKAG